MRVSRSLPSAPALVLASVTLAISVPALPAQVSPKFGSSGNPQAHELKNGVTVVVPSWQALRPDGSCFEGEGLAPDVEVAVEAADLNQRDVILERALEVLREKVGHAPGPGG
ncbi:MAG: hypothetical protein AAF628_24230 [Planctomycetota bacterium]